MHGTLEIQSVGPPPELHADRMIALMLQQIAAERALILSRIIGVMKASSDGGPSGQRKMVGRLKSVCDYPIQLTPGKRGAYYLQFIELVGWDPNRNAEIKPRDELPARPWLCFSVTKITSKGKGRERYVTRSRDFLVVSHHALMRCAMRANVRTVSDVIEMSRRMAAAGCQLLKDQGEDAILNVPPEGWHVPIETGVLVLEKHKTLPILVAITLLPGRAKTAQ